MEMQAPKVEETKNKAIGFGSLNVMKEGSSQFKILTHFIKGKIALSPMETILSIPSELEYLENLVKFVQKKRDDNLNSTNLIKSNHAPTIHNICINKSHRNRILHLLVSVGNNLIEGLIDTRASMSIMLVTIVHELGIMHLVIGMESYKIALGIITQALGKINKIIEKVGEVQCLLTFVVVDIDSYNLLFKLDFLIKNGAIVDVEKGTIQEK
jgi:hypothetical protein